MIEVSISRAKLIAFDNDVHAGMHILNRLREAGIPVVGTIGVRWVENGVLEVEDDELASEDIVFKYRPL